MSHPLVVDAAEREFVPACIYNNTTGDADAALRERFKEPAWNNPVVRITDAQSELIVPRITDDWRLVTLVDAMTRALAARKQPTPIYLELLRRELVARREGVEIAIFGMG
ncbi:MAG: hypothetical protein ACKVX7_12895 [Planctomycetota bacterium]